MPERVSRLKRSPTSVDNLGKYCFRRGCEQHNLGITRHSPVHTHGLVFLAFTFSPNKMSAIHRSSCGATRPMTCTKSGYPQNAPDLLLLLIHSFLETHPSSGCEVVMPRACTHRPHGTMTCRCGMEHVRRDTAIVLADTTATEVGAHIEVASRARCAGRRSCVDCAHVAEERWPEKRNHAGGRE